MADFPMIEWHDLDKDTWIVVWHIKQGGTKVAVIEIHHKNGPVSYDQYRL